MKRSCSIFSVFVVILLAVFLLGGCVQVTVLPDATPTPAAEPTPTAAPALATETAAATAAPPTPTVAAATPVPVPTLNNPTMYSSYADFVSFDPATGIAQFDYFDLLRGDDAVDYLVDHEGYTEAYAKAYVGEFTDAEFVKKNDKSQLRAIDLDDTSLKLMIQPNGEPVDGAESIPSSGSDVRAIYAIDPSMLSMYFYYIHVESDGHVLLVEQVYWS